MGLLLRISILVVVMACARRPTAIPAYRAHIAEVLAPRAALHIAAAPMLAPKPWAVGQWAVYQTLVDGEIGYERLGIVAIEGCGTWVQVVQQAVQRRTTWTACVTVGADGRKRIASLIGDEGGWVSTSGRDPPEGWLLSLFVPTWSPSEGAAGEGVDVFAGHFDGVIREPADRDGTIVWVHPSVPFDGRVKSESKEHRVRELVAFGYAGAPGVIADLAKSAERAMQPARQPRLFTSLGYGLFTPIGSGGEDTDSGVALRARTGARVGRRFEIYGEVIWGQPQVYKPAPTLRQSTSLVLVGTRWTLLEIAGPGVGELYLRGGLGLGTMHRGVSEMDGADAWGLGANAGAGILVHVVEGGGISAEVSDDVLVTGDGARHSISLNASLQVQLPMFWR